MTFSDTAEDLVLDHILGTTELVFDATVFLALGTDDSPSKTTFTELSGNGYARQAIASDPSSGGSTQSTDTLIFGPCTGTAWGIIKSAALFTADTAGTRIAQAALVDQTKFIGVNDTAIFDVGAVDVLFGQTYNVMDYGAHADGVTDDSGHVQAAVDACHAAGGGIVYMPAGTYYLHAKVTLGGDTIDVDGNNLTGSGWQQVNVNVKSGVYVRGAGSDATFVTMDVNNCCAFGACNQQNIGVAGVDATVTYAPDNASGGWKFMYCTGLTLDDLVGHGGHGGFSLVGCRDTLLSDCIAQDLGGIVSTGQGFVVEPINDVGPVLRQSHNVSLTNCEAAGTGDNGTGFRIHGYLVDEAHTSRIDGVSLTDCYAHDFHMGFRVMYATDITMLRATRSGTYPTTNNRLQLINVDGAHFTSCMPAFKITDAIDHTQWVMYGSADCVDITED
jgi:hypothetical protein